MGMSTAATQLLFFTASVALAASVAGYLAVVVQDVARSGEDRGRHLADELRTDVQIINDPAEIPAAPVRFYLKNTGSQTLDPNATTLLVDGVVRAAATFNLLDAATAGVWRTGETVEAADATLTLAAGDHAVVAIVQHGVRDSLKVRV
jgi:archaellum component FlaG (FlaF/FlaG flagellin family)